MAGTALGPRVGQRVGQGSRSAGAECEHPGDGPTGGDEGSHAEFISMIRRSAVVSALRSPLGSPFGPISIPEIDWQSRFSSVRMLIEAAGQCQRRHRSGADVPPARVRPAPELPIRPQVALREVAGNGPWAGIRRRAWVLGASGPGPAGGGNAQSAVICHISVVRFI
jgi:hypothetical protein